MHEGFDPELITVGADEAVVTLTTDPGREVTVRVGDREVTTTGPHHVARFTDLEPATEYPIAVEGVHLGDVDERYLPPSVVTLDRPPGRLLSTVATVNDVHFGETECGRLVINGEDVTGEVFCAEPGSEPYPRVMNHAAVAEIDAMAPDVVVAKGDLTNVGTDEEYAAFLDTYSVFGDRLHHVRGNHDAALSDTLAATGPFRVDLPGVTLAVLDTVRFQRENGRVGTEQLAWLEELAADSDQPVLVFGHHQSWSPRSATRDARYFGIDPDDSEALIGLFGRYDSLAGYFAGHTHRNRVRRFEESRDVPFVEVACVKDYPGVWAEYRIYEGGYTQVVRRISDPAAMEWTEKTRRMFHGLYRDYALGPLDWRCFSERF